MADLITPRHEAHFFGDKLPLFWTFFGFAGCVLMGLICKLISKKALARKEGYYENENVLDNQPGMTPDSIHTHH